MKKILIPIMLSFCFCCPTWGQNDAEKEYNEFKKKASQEYEDFREKANKEYVEFMKKAWTLYKEKPGIPNPQNKEPVVPPVVMKDKETKPQNKPVPYDTIIPSPPPNKEAPKPVAPIYEVAQQKETKKTFTFYGTKSEVRFPTDATFSLPNLNEETIAKAWEVLSKTDYNNTIRDCLENRIHLNLCDWAYLQYVDSVAETYAGKSNEATLLEAFLYCQSGYKMRLGYDSDHLYMLIGSCGYIYEMPYFNIKGENFYPINYKAKQLYIYNNAFPGEKNLSLDIGKEQYLSIDTSAVHILSSRRYPDVRFPIQSNINLINFFNTYPQSCINNDPTTKWQFYANTPLSAIVKNTLYPALANAINGKSEADAANILLNLVQTSFTYKEDEAVWGYDRPFFADETVYYPYSDCEDRAILFSRLVRDLMKLKVVLVYYPGHLATAVRFNENITGDFLQINGEKYLICDPTYINAPIGLTMPKMDNHIAKAVELE